MIYVVTEDQNAARFFWIEVMKAFWEDSEYEMIPLEVTEKGRHAGNLMLSYYFDCAFAKAEKGDTIFVAFDNIGISSRKEISTGKKMAFDSEYFLTNSIKKCRWKEISFCSTYYYCFEEIFLSYTELLKLYEEDSDGSDIADVLEFVQNGIYKGYDYYDKENELVRKISVLRKDALRNREHFADALLYHASSQIKHGLFTVGKQLDKNVKCWILDCGWLCENESVLRKSRYMCEHCKYSERNASTADKLKSVRNKSLLKDGFWVKWC